MTTPQHPEHIVFLIQDHHVACFVHQAGEWVLRRLKGETCIAFKSRPRVLEDLLHDLNDRLHLEHGLTDVPIHWVCDRISVRSLDGLPEIMAELGCDTWQMFRLEPLLERAHAHTPLPPQKPLLAHLEDGNDHNDKDNDQHLSPIEWVLQVLLPIVSSTFFYTDRALAAELDRARQALNARMEQARRSHEDTLESLRAQRQGHETEIRLLQQQVQTLKRPDIAHLLTYLPAFYRNFFGSIRPDELALLAGTLDIPTLPSPYPDPSAHTVYALRKRFLSLPAEEQARVLHFCHQLPHRLEVRSEMSDLLNK